MTHFKYNGPVLNQFGLMSNRWQGETVALSREKAISNLKYQFRQKYKLANHVVLNLPNELIVL